MVDFLWHFVSKHSVNLTEYLKKQPLAHNKNCPRTPTNVRGQPNAFVASNNLQTKTTFRSNAYICN